MAFTLFIAPTSTILGVHYPKTPVRSFLNATIASENRCSSLSGVSRVYTTPDEWEPKDKQQQHCGERRGPRARPRAVFLLIKGKDALLRLARLTNDRPYLSKYPRRHIEFVTGIIEIVG
jgi:hypothetical protein